MYRARELSLDSFEFSFVCSLSQLGRDFLVIRRFYHSVLPLEALLDLNLVGKREK
jgi:hypothetical protein